MSLNQNKKPNFLIVGAAKAGTTSLYNYLRGHAEIFLPERKELRFFSGMKGNFVGPGDDDLNRSIVNSFDEYMNYFQNQNGEKIIGDVSPDYLYYYKNSVQRIRAYLDEPRILIILRNPVERAFSHYLNFIRVGREKLTFEQALRCLNERKKQNWEWAWQYLEVGLYYEQVREYLKNFRYVRIYLFDDLVNNSIFVIRDICEYLDIDSNYVPADISTKYNHSNIPRNKFLQDLLYYQSNYLSESIKNNFKKFLSRNLIDVAKNKLANMNYNKAEISLSTRIRLELYFRENIYKLQELIGRDLSSWLPNLNENV